MIFYKFNLAFYGIHKKKKLECPNYKTVCVRIMRYEIINNEKKGKKKKKR